MSPTRQVDKEHYRFGRYVTEDRWSSLWHQINEVRRLEPSNVLEIGPGPGLFKMVANATGMHVETCDIDPELNPDHVGSADALPLADASFDTVCAFQMLEHLPYARALVAFQEMLRVASRHVVLSLPDARRVWRYELHVPGHGPVRFMIPRPALRLPDHEFDGEHYWEVNKKGYPLSRVLADFGRHAELISTHRIFMWPYYRFFVFRRRPG